MEKLWVLFDFIHCQDLVLSDTLVKCLVISCVLCIQESLKSNFVQMGVYSV